MTAARNRQSTIAFFDEIGTGRFQAAFDRLHEDVTWWSAGGDNLAFAGPLDKAGFIAGIAGFAAIFAAGPRFERRSILAAGDKVAIEQTGRARMRDGRSYDNLYVHLLTFEGDRIIAAREYHDTLYARIVLVDFDSCKGMSAYLCGPPAMVEAAGKALKRRRMAPRRTFKEEFTEAAPLAHAV